VDLIEIYFLNIARFSSLFSTIATEIAKQGSDPTTSEFMYNLALALKKKYFCFKTHYATTYWRCKRFLRWRYN
jgi:hypothetical protein